MSEQRDGRPDDRGVTGGPDDNPRAEFGRRHDSSKTCAHTLTDCLITAQNGLGHGGERVG